jgi:hypothetical protein
MLAFLEQNLATILISAALLAVVIWISAGLVKKKRSGKSIGCDCGCDGCPRTAACHIDKS